MCIIVYKDTFAEKPSTDVLRQCFASNPDGAGLAIIRPKSDRVEIHKGFMDVKSFIDFAQSAVSPEDIAAYHCRITTAGGTRPENCHPFPISGSIADLTALHIKSHFALVHNGILGQGNANLSDTQLYIRDKLAPRSFHTLNKRMLADVETETAGSKLLLMDGLTHDVAIIGAGWITDDATGLRFSNGTYKSQKWAAWYDDDDLSGYAYAPFPCPMCGQWDAENISARHDLYECPDCGCLYDGKGDVWATGENKGADI